MAHDIDQSTRLVSVATPLGEDVLILQGFEGYEPLSRLYAYRLDLLSDEHGIKPADIVGQNVTFTVKQSDGEPRYFNGFVRRFSGHGIHTRGLRHYTADIVPWFWFLTRSADCRIFQNQNVKSIVEEVFKDFGFSDFAFDLQGEHPQRVYCVQYRETAFAFVSRLLEEEGIFYWFKHENGKHTMMLADHKGAYLDCPESDIAYVPGSLKADHITAFEHRYEFTSGKMALTDYNFETPTTSLLTSTNTLVQLPDAKNFEIFDYPGEYVQRSDGEALAKVRMEAEEVPHDVVECASRCRTIFAGGKFKIARHECAEEEGAGYVITGIRHVAVDTTHIDDGGTADYSNTFSCIPDSAVFRPARETPRPAVQGPQTAVVVGPAGEEIYPDKYGRVKVQFHWDRKGKYDENSSCWVRLAQIWAGKGWGAIHIPRVGQEVIVEFLEGNPDDPIVTGRVYHGESMPPYKLPDNKTISGVKSNSSAGGGGFNEIRFEDAKDSEQMLLHAQKNFDARVLNDRFEWVGNDQHLIVKNNKFTTVENNRNEKVTADHKEEIGKDRHVNVKGKEAMSIGESQSLTVTGDVAEVFKANHSEKTSGDYYLKATNIVLEASSNITLKVGGSHVAIEAGGIKLGSGAPIKIDASGPVDISSSAVVTVKGALVKLG